MIIILGTLAILIWIIIFLIGLIFRERKKPYLIYLICSGLYALFLWDTYNASGYATKTTIVFSISCLLAIVGLILFIIGEANYDNMDYPFGKEEKK